VAGWIPSLREKLSNLSEFIREIKVGFTRYYNKRHNRRGYFWGDRFKSVIVEKGETLINCLACIDLNPYFTDSGIIGTKKFVSEKYQRFIGSSGILLETTFDSLFTSSIREL
jgi:hypothetical protein